MVKVLSFFGLHSPLILMEIIHLCSGASTWSLGFGSPSPKKRSGEKAYQVCKAQQWFRTCTKNVISNGSPRDHHQRMWRFKLTLTHEAPMRVGETWKSRGDAFWGQLPSPLGSTTLVFTWKKVWNLSDSWLPPCMVFNTCDLGAGVVFHYSTHQFLLHSSVKSTQHVRISVLENKSFSLESDRERNKTWDNASQMWEM